jgi:mRNA-degrading endonuclease RelE of RelBE toxin-antitoxin system
MTWRIVWTQPARRALERFHWKDAATIDAAVMRFASTGEGSIHRLAEDDATTIRLRVGDVRVRMSADKREGVLWVAWLHRADR